MMGVERECNFLENCVYPAVIVIYLRSASENKSGCRNILQLNQSSPTTGANASHTSWIFLILDKLNAQMVLRKAFIIGVQLDGIFSVLDYMLPRLYVYVQYIVQNDECKIIFATSSTHAIEFLTDPPDR